MEDLIRRADAIKAEADRVYEVLHIAGCKESYEDCLKDAVKTFKDIPSAENKGEWIPCSEKLPSKGGVIVQYSDGDFDLLEFPTAYRRADIVAWMPLPEPYKEGAGE